MKNNQSLNFNNLDPKKYIIIKGAKVNNLKNINIAIPRQKLVVITGLSGSGKSSLAFDTLFAEGHRMYVESLSAYTRQFLSKIEKPNVEYIKGISPAIAIEQKTYAKNSRSTVGTTTEIYDYLKILYSRIGDTYSPVSNTIVKKHTVNDVLEYIKKCLEGTKIIISFPMEIKDWKKNLTTQLTKGYNKIIHNHETYNIEEVLKSKKLKTGKKIDVVVDRIISKNNDDDNSRITDSVQIAFFEGKGNCKVTALGKEAKIFTDKLEQDNIAFEQPSINLFNFNTPFGACKHCEGSGYLIGIDKNKVIPNNKLSIKEEVILPWRSPAMKLWLKPLLENCELYKFPINTPYKDLSKRNIDMIWNGFKDFQGLNKFFEFLQKQSKKIQYRILLSKYKGKTTCSECKGTRIRKEAGYVKIDNKSIIDLLQLSISDLEKFFKNIKISQHKRNISKIVLEEIINRLAYLKKVGLEYLTLSRSAPTLSGGEYQRINLATSLGSTLVGTMYILDEPTVGLHPRDTKKLTEVLIKLKEAGNSVIVVEHDEEVMKAADQLIDIGPESGSNGGHVMFQGSWDELKNYNASYTAKYLNKKEIIPIPKKRREWANSFTIKGARENNLKDIDVTIPLGILTVITGVSGSGKSTLVKKIIYPAIGEALYMNIPEKGQYDYIEGDYTLINELEFIDQGPLMKSSRSNPVTYIKAYENIRNLFANQPLSIKRGYTASTFSFNLDGGRCENCNGDGVNKIEMQFMADIILKCEECQGKRFKKEILEIKIKEKNIYDILSMTVDDSILFFQSHSEIIDKIKPLQDVGLGYICLGQSTSDLSGGEAQRIKLATYLKNNSTNKGHKLYIFDEPTTGLHFHDIKKLLISINKLIEQGNSVVIIEHNLDVIKTADWIIDLGPNEGKQGGTITFAGTPEKMIENKNIITAKYLKEKLENES